MLRLLAPLLAVALVSAAPPGASAATLVNHLEISGSAKDLAPGPDSVNTNRLGGFASDLYFDRFSNSYFGIPDRGPGGGLIDYATRVQEFGLNVNPATGAIGGFALKRTIIFKDAQGNPFNGLNPGLLNGDKSVLGRSFDPEGLVVGKKGTLFVADEYGPSVYEFDRNGKFLRALQTPANLLPREAGNALNFVDGRPTVTTGRQDNRGFEGLARTPDGSKLYAIMQDPLVNEGAQNDGRRSRNLRIVEFDAATGKPGKQFIYQLEALADINARIPAADAFSATNQGRSIGVSTIVAVSDTKFLVIERDNRGLGVDALIGNQPPPAVASKRVYLIDITGATDVSALSLADTSTLPGGVVAVSKTLALDVQAALVAAGLTLPEKLEGLTIGPQLDDGTFALLLGTDNDFSVTQTGDSSTPQLDVCTDRTQVALDAGCPEGSSLVPSFLYAFHDTDNTILAGLVLPLQQVTAPPALALLAASGALLAALPGRRRRD